MLESRFSRDLHHRGRLRWMVCPHLDARNAPLPADIAHEAHPCELPAKGIRSWLVLFAKVKNIFLKLNERKKGNHVPLHTVHLILIAPTQGMYSMYIPQTTSICTAI